MKKKYYNKFIHVYRILKQIKTPFLDQSYTIYYKIQIYLFLTKTFLWLR